MQSIPFQVIDWSGFLKTTKAGASGTSSARAFQWEGLRIRMVEYSAGYLADHWCKKGHIVHCLEGEFTSELQSGEKFILSRGMTYVVSDDMSSHRSRTEHGVKLIIIDGDFLRNS